MNKNKHNINHNNMTINMKKMRHYHEDNTNKDDNKILAIIVRILKLKHIDLNPIIQILTKIWHTPNPTFFKNTSCSHYQSNHGCRFILQHAKGNSPFLKRPYTNLMLVT